MSKKSKTRRDVSHSHSISKENLSNSRMSKKSKTRRDVSHSHSKSKEESQNRHSKDKR